MIEYHLTQYLISEFPALNFVVNGFGAATPDDVISVNYTGGTPAHWYSRIDHSIQLLIRNSSVTIGRVNALSVYEKIKNRFGLELPSVTIDSVVYPAVKTYQISPIQSPGYLGADDRGLEMYSFNVVVTTIN